MPQHPSARSSSAYQYTYREAGSASRRNERENRDKAGATQDPTQGCIAAGLTGRAGQLLPEPLAGKAAEEDLPMGRAGSGLE